MTTERSASADRAARVAVIGLGSIGRLAAEQVGKRPDLILVAAVDPARSPGAIGGVTTTDALGDGVDVDVALICTSSDLDAVARQSLPLLERGVHVVSSCEVLAFPWPRHAETAELLERAARRSGAVIVGAGVNPGFVMDVLPAVAASASMGVCNVAVTRRVDLRRRRPQLSEKMGIGCDERAWYEREATWGHRGLVESLQVLSIATGIDSDEVVFDRHALVQDGTVVGVTEVASTAADGKTIEMSLTFGLDIEDLDEIRITGTPDLVLRVEGGTPGDTATVARLVHCARVVSCVEPGLRLPTELPAAGTWRR